MNKDGYVYSIVFTFLLTAFFAAILAVTYAAYSPVIKGHEENLHRQAVAKVLGLGDADPLPSAVAMGEIPVFSGGQSYAVPIKGSGLWGPIQGYIGISADFRTLLGLEFVEQNETPGLGGRIDEAWFKEQFRGVPISPHQPLTFGDSLEAVTGATASSNAVLRIINDALEGIFPFAEVMGP